MRELSDTLFSMATKNNKQTKTKAKETVTNSNSINKIPWYKEFNALHKVIIGIALAILLSMVGIYIYKETKEASEVAPLDESSWLDMLSIIDDTKWITASTKDTRHFNDLLVGYTSSEIYILRDGNILNLYLDSGMSYDEIAFELINGIATADYLSKEIYLYFSESNNKSGRAITLIVNGEHIVFKPVE